MAVVRGLAIWLLVGCAHAASPARPGEVHDERCGMIAAALRTAEIRKFACGQAATEHGRIVVEVQIEPPLAERCTRDGFVLYRQGQPVNTDALLQLSFGVSGPETWAVGASFVDPPNSPDDQPTADGGFDSANYYCHIMGVRVTRTADGWRTWHDAAW